MFISWHMPSQIIFHHHPWSSISKIFFKIQIYNFDFLRFLPNRLLGLVFIGCMGINYWDSMLFNEIRDDMKMNVRDEADVVGMQWPIF